MPESGHSPDSNPGRPIPYVADGSSSSSSSDVGDDEHGDEHDMSDDAATHSHDGRHDFMRYMSEEAVSLVQPSCTQTVAGSDLHADNMYRAVVVALFVGVGCKFIK